MNRSTIGLFARWRHPDTLDISNMGAMETRNMHLIDTALTDIPFRCLSDLGVEAVSGRSYAGPPVAESYLTTVPD